MATVFISYAHRDKDLAVWVAESLRAGGVDVRRDEERMVRGYLHKRIDAEIANVDCGLFLVSREWLVSDPCLYEAQKFSDRDRARNAPEPSRILVCLEPYSSLSLPPALATLVAIDCASGTDRDAALWRIYCAITQTDLGDPRKFSENGRNLSVNPNIVPVTAPGGAIEVRNADEAEVLECDRYPEFDLVKRSYVERRHQLFIVAGPKHEAHEYFVTRIEEKLEATPPYKPIRVRWRGDQHPVSAGVYRERLARAIGCAKDADLPYTLRSMMQAQNVVLIHPLIESDYDDDAIVACFKEWLPEVIEQVRPSLQLKCVQPIAWEVSKGWAAAARKWFGGGDTGGENEKHALALIEKLGQLADPIRATGVRLKPITITHVEDFCDVFRLPPDERTRLLARIREREAETSQQILKIIDEFMQERRGQRAAG